MDHDLEGAVVAAVAIEEVRAIERTQTYTAPSSCLPLRQLHSFNIILYVKEIFRNFGGVQLPYFKSLGVDGAQYQTFSVIALTPWAMKGLIGTISDSFAFGGYHKRYYMILCCFGGFIALSLLGFLPYSVASKHIWIPPILFFFVMFQVATLDLLIEGKYTEKMRDHPERASDMPTFVWTCITLGSLVGSAFVGPVTDYLGSSVIFFICLPLSIHLIVPLFMGYLPEAKVSPDLHNRLQTQKIKEKGLMFLVGVTTAIAALLLAVCGLLGSSKVQSIYSFVASVIMISLAYYAMPRHLADCNFYMYLQESLYISLAGALDFWYTASPNCVPGGPNFDYTYYQTYSQLVGHAASIIGLWLFQTVMSKWKFRYVYWVTTFLRVLASSFDLIIIKRWNISLGISDKWFYLLGDAIVFPMCQMLNFMPGVLLTAKLCPHSMESTVYAILAGFSNFGSNTAKSIGVFMQRVAGIETQEPNCNFDNLPLLIVIGHCLIPLISVPLTFILLPNSRMTDPLVDDSIGSGKTEDGGQPSFFSTWQSTSWKETLSALCKGRVPISRTALPIISNELSSSSTDDGIEMREKRLKTEANEGFKIGRSQSHQRLYSEDYQNSEYGSCSSEAKNSDPLNTLNKSVNHSHDDEQQNDGTKYEKSHHGHYPFTYPRYSAIPRSSPPTLTQLKCFPSDTRTSVTKPTSTETPSIETLLRNENDQLLPEDIDSTNLLPPLVPPKASCFHQLRRLDGPYRPKKSPTKSQRRFELTSSSSIPVPRLSAPPQTIGSQNVQQTVFLNRESVSPRTISLPPNSNNNNDSQD